MKREQITKKIRFEVFKRDNFTCQYCGKNPPEVTLEIDHIEPVSKGGTNNINNLLTACFKCNRGKSNNLLNKIPNTLVRNLEILTEQQEQYKQYKNLINEIETEYQNQIENINIIYNSWFPKFVLLETFKNSSVKLFLKKIPYNEIKDAMNNACSKINHYDDSLKYFCGICWNIIKEKNNNQ